MCRSISGNFRLVFPLSSVIYTTQVNLLHQSNSNTTVHHYHLSRIHESTKYFYKSDLKLFSARKKKISNSWPTSLKCGAHSSVMGRPQPPGALTNQTLDARDVHCTPAQSCPTLAVVENLQLQQKVVECSTGLQLSIMLAQVIWYRSDCRSVNYSSPH